MDLGEEKEFSWDERLQIAVDISHGIQYLHEGVCSMIYFLLYYVKMSLVNMNMHGTGSPTSDTSRFEISQHIAGSLSES